MNAPVRILCLALCLVFAADTSAVAQLFHRELQLPRTALSERVTRRVNVAPGSTVVLFDEQGPGALLHWWLTYWPNDGQPNVVQNLQLKIYYDGEAEPTVDVSLAQYFSILLNKDAYMLDNAAVKILPKNALNSYLPIPFRSLRIELQNQGEANAALWFMGDWHRYPDSYDLTPLRLHVIHQQAFPADSAGSFLMADLTGNGFIAGLTMGVRVEDDTDFWYHTGGDLVLLDGKTHPRALRGIGGEDVFGMSFGVWDVQTKWIGTAYTYSDGEGRGTAENPAYDELVAYRIFGPAPISFESSAVVRFGSKANDLESVVYAYLDSERVDTPAILTPDQWKLAGPFQTNTFTAFKQKEWAERPVGTWPEEYTADFGQYISNLHGLPQTATTFNLPVHAQSEHGWVDFARHFRGRRRANAGTQPVNVSAYAVGTLNIEEAGTYSINVGFDDWLTLWINGEKVFTERHDQGFEVEKISHQLPASEVAFRVKLSNKNNFQWRLWTFSFTLEKQKSAHK